jgi:hypothetical protein
VIIGEGKATGVSKIIEGSLAAALGQHDDRPLVRVSASAGAASPT